MADLTRPTIPTDDDLVGKPSLAETLKWAKEVQWVYSSKFQRLVEAAEFEHRNGSKAFDCYNTRSKAEDWRCPLRDKFDQQIQALRRQLDELGKENAGKGRRIKELKKERKAWTDEVVERGQIIKAMGIAKDHRLDEDEEIKELRSRLVGRERELERCGETIYNQREQIQGLKDKTLKQSGLFFEQQKELERLRKSDGCKTCRVCPYVTDLETAEKELEGLRVLTDEDYDRLNRFNSRIRMLETKMGMIKKRKPGWFRGKSQGLKELQALAEKTDDPEADKLARQVKADIHSDTPLGEKLRGKLFPDLDEAEVEEVAKTVFEKYEQTANQHFWSNPEKKKRIGHEGLVMDGRKQGAYAVARHVIERGYSPTEKNCRAGRKE